MSLKRTPLYDLHLKRGAKLVEFAGWEMPLYYRGILEEHRAVREDVGLFDVSHMGQIVVRGAGALALLDHLLPNDVEKLTTGQALYSPMCNEEGGTLDDLIVYRLPDRFLLVVNAATSERDLRWIQEHALRFEGVEVASAVSARALLALQGPRVEEALQGHVAADLSRVGRFRTIEAEFERASILISRTGYTGEDGFEISGPPEAMVQLWKKLTESGVTPAGLGARDSLRLEAGLPLYGHELDEKTTPVEAGLGWTVKEKPTDYVGKEALLRQKREGTRRRLVGFVMREAGVPRPGYAIHCRGREAGRVTSGMRSPTLGGFLGMGYITAEVPLLEGEEIAVEIRGELRAAEIRVLPFYRGSAG